MRSFMSMAHADMGTLRAAVEHEQQRRRDVQRELESTDAALREAVVCLACLTHVAAPGV